MKIGTSQGWIQDFYRGAVQNISATGKNGKGKNAKSEDWGGGTRQPPGSITASITSKIILELHGKSETDLLPLILSLGW